MGYIEEAILSDIAREEERAELTEQIMDLLDSNPWDGSKV
jgi:hypothetical protein